MAASSGTDTPTPSEAEDRKLWIGNLDNSVTEYQLLQILRRFGKIEKFEYLFHLHGQLKGKPKGYCFIKYETKTESETAKRKLNGVQLASKKIIVDWARRRQHIPSERITSLMKSEKQDSAGTEISKEKKIKAIEAKLRSMEQGEMTSNPWKGILTSGNHIARVRKHPYKQFNKRPHQRQQR